MFSVLRNILPSLASHPVNLICAACPSTGLLSALPAGATALNVTSQRFKYRARKPLGLPRARKKRYWSRPVRPIDEEEYKELYWRYSHYRAARTSLKAYFQQWKAEHYPEEEPKNEDIDADKKASGELSEDLRLSLEENERENAKIIKIRDVRRKEYLKFKEDERLDVYEEHQRVQNEIRHIGEEWIRRKKNISSILVTEANVDERILHAFENPTDYNFCIDWNGRRTFGRPDPLRKYNLYVPRSRMPPPPGDGKPPRPPVDPKKITVEAEDELDRMLADVDKQFDQAVAGASALRK